MTNRLMQDADGTILVSHDTYNQVRGVFDVEPDAPLRMRRGRGRARQEPISVYRVLAAKARAFRRSARGVEGVETQMVAREGELRTLQNAFLDAVEERETQVVTVVGAAGLGKSRLLWEFAEWSDLRPERFWILRGRATPEMSDQPYALLHDLLSFRFEILDSDPPAVVQAKLEAGVRGQIGEDDELAHLIGHLAGYDLSGNPLVEGLRGDPQQLAQQARFAFTRWVVRLCATNPVVFELEDIHHADEATLALLTALVSEHRDLPLLVVCLARPELFERRPTWGSGQEFHTRLELRPLDRRESRALVREILQQVDEVPRTLRDLLVERSEGNPYYMEELVKMLLDERVIAREGEGEGEARWRVEAARVDRLSVPATLVGLLQARLDGLLYPERLALQRAAVVGRVFWDGALVALDAADETHLDDLPGVLRRLAEGEFVHVRETTAFHGHTEYVFSAGTMSGRGKGRRRPVTWVGRGRRPCTAAPLRRRGRCWNGRWPCCLRRTMGRGCPCACGWGKRSGTWATTVPPERRWSERCTSPSSSETRRVPPMPSTGWPGWLWQKATIHGQGVTSRRACPWLGAARTAPCWPERCTVWGICIGGWAKWRTPARAAPRACPWLASSATPPSSCMP